MRGGSSGVDIPLMAGQDIPTFGFMSPQQRINMQVLALKLQQAQQNQNAQNMLRSLYGNQENFDPTTNQLKPAALNMLTAAYPQEGMAVRTDMLKNQEEQARAAYINSNVMKGYKSDLVNEVTIPSLKVYDDALASGKPPPEAQQMAQQSYTNSLNDWKSSNAPPPSFAQSLAPNFDPVRARNNSLVFKQQQAAEKEQLANTKTQTDIDKAKHDMKLKDFQENRGAYTPATQVTVDDGKGGVKSVLAQQDKDSGGWVTADAKHTPLEGVTGIVPKTGSGQVERGVNYTTLNDKGEQVQGVATFNKNSGQYVDTVTGKVVKPTSIRSPEAGQTGRAGQITQRMLNAASEAIADVSNIADLPIGTSKGIFGHVQPGTGLLDAPRSAIGNTLSSQDAQIYNAATTGLARGLTMLDSGGVYINQHLTDQLDKLQLAPGDTVATKLVKMAETRQIADQSLQSLMTSPILTNDQKKFITGQMETLKKAIPFSVADVSAFVYGSDPNDTIRKVAKERLGTPIPPKEASTQGTANPNEIKLPTPVKIRNFPTVYPNITYEMLQKLKPGDHFTYPGSPNDIWMK